MAGHDRPLPAGHPLTPLLTAATAPGTDRELAGEAVATDAFRAAAHAPAPVRGRRPLLGLLSLKVVAAAFATTATVGGVALAAGTGALTGPISPAGPAGTASSTGPSAATGPATAAGPGTSADGPGGATSQDGAASPLGPSSQPEASDRPEPSGSATSRRGVGDLCADYGSRDRDGRRRALDDERFGELVRRAGREDRVERYCSELTRQNGRPSGTSRRTGDDRAGPGGYGNDNDNDSNGNRNDGYSNGSYGNRNDGNGSGTDGGRSRGDGGDRPRSGVSVVPRR